MIALLILQLEAGVELSWTAGSNATSFGLGAIYKPDRFSTFRVSYGMGKFANSRLELVGVTITMYFHVKAFI